MELQPATTSVALHTGDMDARSLQTWLQPHAREREPRYIKDARSVDRLSCGGLAEQGRNGQVKRCFELACVGEPQRTLVQRYCTL